MQKAAAHIMPRAGEIANKLPLLITSTTDMASQTKIIGLTQSVLPTLYVYLLFRIYTLDSTTVQVAVNSVLASI